MPLAVLLFACAREPQGEEAAPEGDAVVYTFRAQAESGVKASVSDEGVCYWSENDQIAVYDERSAAFCTFTSPAGDGIFTFEGEPGVEYSFTHAYYPASAVKGVSSVALPAEYTQAQAQSASFFPMLAKVDGETLHFRHLGALLRFTVTNIPAQADAIVVSSNEVGLCGDFPLEGSGLDDGWLRGEGEDMSVNPSVPVKSAETAEEIHAKEGSGSVRIAVNPGENSNLVLYLPLPVGAYTCSFSLYEGENEIVKIKTEHLKDVERAKLVRISSISIPFSGGLGTPEKPYLISKEEDLKALSELFQDENFSGASYALKADLNLTGIFTPIGSVDVPFTGTFDGEGHTVSGLNVQSTGANAGLFGYLKGATVKDITISGASVHADANYAGAISGVLNGGTISGCLVDAESSISSSKRGAGGIVGFVRTGTVRECASHANMTAGEDCAGGISGYLNTNAEDGNILVINCVFEPVYKDGKLSGATLKTSNANAYMGGISGSATATSGLGKICIANCYAYPLELSSTQASGTVVKYVGGIVGRMTSRNISLFNCLTPVTYSNVIIGGTRLDAGTYSTYTAAACITGTVSEDGSSVRRTFSKNTWPVAYYSSKNVTTSDISLKMGDGGMRGYGPFAFSGAHPVSGKKTYSEAEGGVLQALNDGVAAWNADNAGTPALDWAYDPTLGYPKPAGVDAPGVTTKKVSLIGDSISTYAGYIFDNDAYQMNAFYPDFTAGKASQVHNEQNTWWWKIIYGKMTNARLEADNAFGGSTVSYLEEKVEGMAKDPNDRMKEYSFQQRYLDYGVGKPDILFFHGGRNDFGQFGGNTDVLLGSYDAESLQAAYDAAPGTLFGNYSQGTVAILRDFHSKFPAAKVLVIVHDQMSDGFEDAAMAITEFMVGKGCDAKCVTLHERGTSNKTNTTIGINKESGTHPNIVGCENMANYVFEQVGSWLED